MAQRQMRSDDTSFWEEGFGNGSDGALTVSSNTTNSPTNTGLSGDHSEGVSSIAVGSTTGFSSGQVIIIHQTRGTNFGKWELNVVSSVSAPNLLLKYPTTNAYYDTGGLDQCQIQVLPQYSSVTVNSSVTYGVQSWDGNKSGILAFLCSGTTSIQGTLSAAGSSGATGSCDCVVTGATGGGFRGGDGDQRVNDNSGQGNAGEGSNSAITNSDNTSGSGGGAGRGNAAATGAGGGHGTAGGNGVNNGGTGTNGVGGIAVGNASLTLLNLGGGGAGATDNPNNGIGSGGSGGGIILVISRDILLGSSSSVYVRGGNGGGPTKWGGGGGAGGSVLFKAATADIGTNRIDCSGSSAGSGSSGSGGAGGVGRAHIDYSVSLTGSTNLPSIDSTLDTSLGTSTRREENYTLLL